jgi:hypothetical protein
MSLPNEIIINILRYSNSHNVSLRCNKRFNQLCTFVFYDEYKQQFFSHCKKGSLYLIVKMIHIFDKDTLINGFIQSTQIHDIRNTKSIRQYLINYENFNPYYNHCMILYFCIENSLGTSLNELLKHRFNDNIIRSCITMTIKKLLYSMFEILISQYPYLVSFDHIEMVVINCRNFKLFYKCLFRNIKDEILLDYLRQHEIKID